MKAAHIISAACALLVLASCSQEPKPVLQYDFSKSEGSSVKNMSGTHPDGRLYGSAKLEDFDGMRVVNLGDADGYIDMGPEIGATLKASSAFTIAVKYFVSEELSFVGQGYFLWAFSTQELNTRTEGRYTAYKLLLQRSENSIGGWTRETIVESGKPSAKGAWQYAVYTQDGDMGTLYINGELISSGEMFPMDTTFPEGETPLYNWMGRAPFPGDHFLANTCIADVRIYTEALPEEKVVALSAKML